MNLFRRSATLRPHATNGSVGSPLDRIPHAASTRTRRAHGLPALVIEPRRGALLDVFSDGTKPRYEATWCASWNRPASSITEMNVAAPINPIYGTVASNTTTGSREQTS